MARKSTNPKTTGTYQHPEADLLMRPEVGTQAQFKKKKAPVTYRYDSSLSPQLEWDGKNPAREAGEALIKEIADCGLRIAELGSARVSRAVSGVPPETSAVRDKELATQIETLKSSAEKNQGSTESRPTGNGHAPVAIVFGPENGAVSEKLVYEAAREAHAKNYTHLYVIGFAIQPNARELVEKCQEVVGVPTTYVQATPDLMMGDLLKNMRSSQIFSVCGLPEVKVSKVQSPKSKASYQEKMEPQYQVELLGMDVFDPISMDVAHQSGNDVPAWFLDTDYNGLCFHVSQAFFPKTGAWENLKKALKGDCEESVWDHLAGTVSAPFASGEH
ncbi:MAG: hypothetical protein ACYDH9_08830 [Limisphaerales bacterium]